MADQLRPLFSQIADAIRDKNGETGTITPGEFPAKIQALETGGGEAPRRPYQGKTFEALMGYTILHGKGPV